ncbi:MAG TPA: hypothetical protein VKT70_09715, partial [Stellaceae bacterium]|nr:hypothetical protein [Stellaceae bacterium]
MKRVRWAVRTARRLLHRRNAYVILMPPGCKRQIVFARKQRRFHRYWLRSMVDQSVLEQIFETEDYKLTDGRGPGIVALYER